MNNEDLDDFGKSVITHFYDKGMDYLKMLCEQQYKVDKNLQKQITGLGDAGVKILEKACMSTLDTALHDFLFALQNSFDRGSKFSFIVGDTNVAEYSDGLNGELYGDTGCECMILAKNAEKPVYLDGVTSVCKPRIQRTRDSTIMSSVGPTARD